jgi:hypothetical protein
MNPQEKAKAAISQLPRLYGEFDNSMQKDKGLHYIIIGLELLRPIANGTHMIVPVEPTEKMWGSDLVRAIVRWLEGDTHRSSGLFNQLTLCGIKKPQWLVDEKEMASAFHTVSKGTRAVILYRAMINEVE